MVHGRHRDRCHAMRDPLDRHDAAVHRHGRHPHVGRLRFKGHGAALGIAEVLCRVYADAAFQLQDLCLDRLRHHRRPVAGASASAARTTSARTTSARTTSAATAPVVLRDRHPDRAGDAIVAAARRPVRQRRRRIRRRVVVLRRLDGDCLRVVPVARRERQPGPCKELTHRDDSQGRVRAPVRRGGGLGRPSGRPGPGGEDRRRGGRAGSRPHRRQAHRR